MESDFTVQVLTLNIWGSPYARHRPERMQAIASRIRELNPEVIALQEAYLADDRKALLEQLVDSGWAHWHYFASGMLGSGLLTLARYPIEDAGFLRFRLGGKPEKIWHGDYYAGKGIGMVRLNTPAGWVDVYNCHPHAQYKNNDQNEYAAYTNSNLYEAARFIQQRSGVGTYPVILCGDLNTQPRQTGYRTITALTGLADAYSQVHPNTHPITYSERNPYTGDASQCLDYIMLRGTANQRLQARQAELVMTEAPTGYDRAKAYSDHYGLLVTVSLSYSADETRPSPDSTATAAVLAELDNLLEHALARTLVARSTHTEHAVLGLAALLDITVTFGVLQRRLRWLTGWRNWLYGLALLYALYHGLQDRVSLAARQQVIEALRSEIRWHRQSLQTPDPTH